MTEQQTDTEGGIPVSKKELPERKKPLVPVVAAVRRVRTLAGVKRFGAPINTPIVRDPVTGKLKAVKEDTAKARIGGEKTDSTASPKSAEKPKAQVKKPSDSKKSGSSKSSYSDMTMQEISDAMVDLDSKSPEWSKLKAEYDKKYDERAASKTAANEKTVKSTPAPELSDSPGPDDVRLSVPMKSVGFSSLDKNDNFNTGDKRNSVEHWVSGAAARKIRVGFDDDGNMVIAGKRRDIAKWGADWDTEPLLDTIKDPKSYGSHDLKHDGASWTAKSKRESTDKVAKTSKKSPDNGIEKLTKELTAEPERRREDVDIADAIKELAAKSAPKTSTSEESEQFEARKQAFKDFKSKLGKDSYSSVEKLKENATKAAEGYSSEELQSIAWTAGQAFGEHKLGSILRNLASDKSKLKSTETKSSAKAAKSSSYSKYSDQTLLDTVEKLSKTDPNSSEWPALYKELSKRGLADKAAKSSKTSYSDMTMQEISDAMVDLDSKSPEWSKLKAEYDKKYDERAASKTAANEKTVKSTPAPELSDSPGPDDVRLSVPMKSVGFSSLDKNDNFNTGDKRNSVEHWVSGAAARKIRVGFDDDGNMVIAGKRRDIAKWGADWDTEPLLDTIKDPKSYGSHDLKHDGASWTAKSSTSKTKPTSASQMSDDELLASYEESLKNPPTTHKAMAHQDFVKDEITKRKLKVASTKTTGKPGEAKSGATTSFVQGKQTALGKVNTAAKKGDPEHTTPKKTFADGTTPAVGQRVTDASGRAGEVVETYQAYTKVKWDDSKGSGQSVANSKLNSSATGKKSLPTKPTKPATAENKTSSTMKSTSTTKPTAAAQKKLNPKTAGVVSDLIEGHKFSNNKIRNSKDISLYLDEHQEYNSGPNSLTESEYDDAFNAVASKLGIAVGKNTPPKASTPAAKSSETKAAAPSAKESAGKSFYGNISSWSDAEIRNELKIRQKMKMNPSDPMYAIITDDDSQKQTSQRISELQAELKKRKGSSEKKN